ncbi:hypothetical protein BS78_K250700 [Paspalum vaginatum]|uniref:Uncharacterized protein n=1 Tax=Paspalum vaginatum TaxID=158149 RepID=A0A9W8CCU3_9POAL|nr:hypothetical protein BS78_K250700 [Paspalum vaginatum]
MPDLTLPSPPLPATPPASSPPSSIPAGSPQHRAAESARPAPSPPVACSAPHRLAPLLQLVLLKSLQRLHARYRAPPTQPVTAHGPASWAGDLWSAPAISAPPLVDLLLLFYLHSSRAVASPSLLISQEINSCMAHFFLLR